MLPLEVNTMAEKGQGGGRMDASPSSASRPEETAVKTPVSSSGPSMESPIPDRPDRLPLEVDKRLPMGWWRKVVQRQTGSKAGKYDVYVYSPEGKKFRSKCEIERFLEENSVTTISAQDFDFSVYGTGSGNTPSRVQLKHTAPKGKSSKGKMPQVLSTKAKIAWNKKMAAHKTKMQPAKKSAAKTFSQKLVVKMNFLKRKRSAPAPEDNGSDGNSDSDEDESSEEAATKEVKKAAKKKKKKKSKKKRKKEEESQVQAGSSVGQSTTEESLMKSYASKSPIKDGLVILLDDINLSQKSPHKFKLPKAAKEEGAVKEDRARRTSVHDITTNTSARDTIKGTPVQDMNGEMDVDPASQSGKEGDEEDRETAQSDIPELAVISPIKAGGKSPPLTAPFLEPESPGSSVSKSVVDTPDGQLRGRPAGVASEADNPGCGNGVSGSAEGQAKDKSSSSLSRSNKHPAAVTAAAAVTSQEKVEEHVENVPTIRTSGRVRKCPLKYRFDIGEEGSSTASLLRSLSSPSSQSSSEESARTTEEGITQESPGKSRKTRPGRSNSMVEKAESEAVKENKTKGRPVRSNSRLEKVDPEAVKDSTTKGRPTRSNSRVENADSETVNEDTTKGRPTRSNSRVKNADSETVKEDTTKGRPTRSNSRVENADSETVKEDTTKGRPTRSNSRVEKADTEAVKEDTTKGRSMRSPSRVEKADSESVKEDMTKGRSKEVCSKDQAENSKDDVEESDTGPMVRRGRARGRKSVDVPSKGNESQQEPSDAQAGEEVASPLRRGRGNPRKRPATEEASPKEGPDVTTESPDKQQRGRPKRAKPGEGTAEESVITGDVNSEAEKALASPSTRQTRGRPARGPPEELPVGGTVVKGSSNKEATSEGPVEGDQSEGAVAVAAVESPPVKRWRGRTRSQVSDEGHTTEERKGVADATPVTEEEHVPEPGSPGTGGRRSRGRARKSPELVSSPTKGTDDGSSTVTRQPSGPESGGEETPPGGPRNQSAANTGDVCPPAVSSSPEREGVSGGDSVPPDTLVQEPTSLTTDRSATDDQVEQDGVVTAAPTTAESAISVAEAPGEKQEGEAPGETPPSTADFAPEVRDLLPTESETLASAVGGQEAAQSVSKAMPSEEPVEKREPPAQEASQDGAEMTSDKAPLTPGKKEEEEAKETESESTAGQPVKRTRGRPRKSPLKLDIPAPTGHSVESRTSGDSLASPVKRPRGRPRKYPPKGDAYAPGGETSAAPIGGSGGERPLSRDATGAANQNVPEKRGRGRPRKRPLEEDGLSASPPSSSSSSSWALSPARRGLTSPRRSDSEQDAGGSDMEPLPPLVALSPRKSPRRPKPYFDKDFVSPTKRLIAYYERERRFNTSRGCDEEEDDDEEEQEQERQEREERRRVLGGRLAPPGLTDENDLICSPPPPTVESPTAAEPEPAVSSEPSRLTAGQVQSYSQPVQVLAADTIDYRTSDVGAAAAYLRLSGTEFKPNDVELQHKDTDLELFALAADPLDGEGGGGGGGLSLSAAEVDTGYVTVAESGARTVTNLPPSVSPLLSAVLLDHDYTKTFRETVCPAGGAQIDLLPGEPKSQEALVTVASPVGLAAAAAAVKEPLPRVRKVVVEEPEVRVKKAPVKATISTGALPPGISNVKASLKACKVIKSGAARVSFDVSDVSRMKKTQRREQLLGERVMKVKKLKKKEGRVLPPHATTPHAAATTGTPPTRTAVRGTDPRVRFSKMPPLSEKHKHKHRLLTPSPSSSSSPSSALSSASPSPSSAKKSKSPLMSSSSPSPSPVARREGAAKKSLFKSLDVEHRQVLKGRKVVTVTTKPPPALKAKLAISASSATSSSPRKVEQLALPRKSALKVSSSESVKLTAATKHSSPSSPVSPSNGLQQSSPESSGVKTAGVKALEHHRPSSPGEPGSVTVGAGGAGSGSGARDVSTTVPRTAGLTAASAVSSGTAAATAAAATTTASAVTTGTPGGKPSVRRVSIGGVETHEIDQTKSPGPPSTTFDLASLAFVPPPPKPRQRKKSTDASGKVSPKVKGKVELKVSPKVITPVKKVVTNVRVVGGPISPKAPGRPPASPGTPKTPTTPTTPSTPPVNPTAPKSILKKPSTPCQ